MDPRSAFCHVSPGKIFSKVGVCRETGDGGRETEDGGQRAEGGGQKTEDRRQKTEGRGRKTEGGVKEGDLTETI